MADFQPLPIRNDYEQYTSQPKHISYAGDSMASPGVISLSSKDGVNDYLAALLSPLGARPVPLPDLRTTRTSGKSVSLDQTISGTDFVLIYQPRFRNAPFLLGRATINPTTTRPCFGVTQVISYDDTMSNNWLLYRDVAAGFYLKTEGIPSGAFSISGRFNATPLYSIMELDDLDIDRMAQFNQTESIQGCPILDGVAGLMMPVSDSPFLPIDPQLSQSSSNSLSFRLSWSNVSALPTWMIDPIAGIQNLAVINKGTLPSFPGFAGTFSILVNYSYEALGVTTSFVGVNVEFYYVNSSGALALAPDIPFQTNVINTSYNNANTTATGPNTVVHERTFRTAYPIAQIVIRRESTVDHVSRSLSVTLTVPDYYDHRNYTSTVVQLEGGAVGQVYGLTATHMYELVPKPSFLTDVTYHTHVRDTYADFESALTVCKFDPNIKPVYTGPDLAAKRQYFNALVARHNVDNALRALDFDKIWSWGKDFLNGARQVAKATQPLWAPVVDSRFPGSSSVLSTLLAMDPPTDVDPVLDEEGCGDGIISSLSSVPSVVTYVVDGIPILLPVVSEDQTFIKMVSETTPSDAATILEDYAGFIVTYQPAASLVPVALAILKGLAAQGSVLNAMDAIDEKTVSVESADAWEFLVNSSPAGRAYMKTFMKNNKIAPNKRASTLLSPAFQQGLLQELTSVSNSEFGVMLETFLMTPLESASMLVRVPVNGLADPTLALTLAHVVWRTPPDVTELLIPEPVFNAYVHVFALKRGFHYTIRHTGSTRFHAADSDVLALMKQMQERMAALESDQQKVRRENERLKKELEESKMRAPIGKKKKKSGGVKIDFIDYATLTGSMPSIDVLRKTVVAYNTGPRLYTMKPRGMRFQHFPIVDMLSEKGLIATFVTSLKPIGTYEGDSIKLCSYQLLRGKHGVDIMVDTRLKDLHALNNIAQAWGDRFLRSLKASHANAIEETEEGPKLVVFLTVLIYELGSSMFDREIADSSYAFALTNMFQCKPDGLYCTASFKEGKFVTPGGLSIKGKIDTELPLLCYNSDEVKSTDPTLIGRVFEASNNSFQKANSLVPVITCTSLSDTAVYGLYILNAYESTLLTDTEPDYEKSGEVVKTLAEKSRARSKSRGPVRDDEKQPLQTFDPYEEINYAVKGGVNTATPDDIIGELETILTTSGVTLKEFFTAVADVNSRDRNHPVIQSAQSVKRLYHYGILNDNFELGKPKTAMRTSPVNYFVNIVNGLAQIEKFVKGGAGKPVKKLRGRQSAPAPPLKKTVVKPVELGGDSDSEEELMQFL